MKTGKFCLGIILILPTTTFAQTMPTNGSGPDMFSRTSLKGSFRLRSEASDQTDFASRRNFNLIRFRAGLDFKTNEEVNIFFQPQFSKTIGEPSYIGNSTTTNSFQQTSGTTYDSGMSVHQAYVRYHPNESYEVLAGRQVLSFGDELVIGGLDWHNVSRSFDALRVNILNQESNNTLFASKIVDMNTVSQSSSSAKVQGDRNLFGLYNTYNFGESLRSFEPYFFYQTDHTQEPITYQKLSTDLYVFGLRASSKLQSFDYRMEATGQDGSSNIKMKNAYQVDLELAYGLNAKAKPRFAVEAFSSGRNYDQLYPTVHKWLGIADILGRRNLSGGAFHYSHEWSEKFSTVLDYHHFIRTNTSETAFKLNGQSNLGSVASSNSRKIGDEIDLVGKYKLNQALTLTGGGGYLFAGAYLRDQFMKKDPIFTYIQLESNF